MSYQTIDTLIITLGIDIEPAVDKINTVFSNAGFSLNLNDTFRLEDFIESDSPKSGEYVIKTKDDGKAFLERLKNHKAGGSVSYVNEDMNLLVLVAFTSLNDTDICAIKIYVQWDLAKLHKQFFQLLIADIKNNIAVLAVLQGSELHAFWDEEPLIEAVQQGNRSRYSEFILEIESKS